MADQAVPIEEEAPSIVGRIRHLAATHGEDAVYRHVGMDGAERAVTWGWLDRRSAQLAHQSYTVTRFP